MERKIEIVEFKKLNSMPKLLRVAAYARVSSSKDDMLHSLAAQVSYYSDLIQSNPEWLYSGVFSDEAKTGTKDRRDGFQNLIDICRKGKIDLIITKSISRFARNTVDTLTTVRELKSLGVDVYFEEQNMHTIGPDGELILTILAAYAQAESLSASENQKWRVKKAFEQGELYNLRMFFGYDISKEGIRINPIEAPIVREIFDRFIGGETLESIAKDMNEREVKRPLGGVWDGRRIRDILTNEKYCGNALLWKTFRDNHLTKRKKKNQGEFAKYYVEGSHEAIIDETVFAAAAKRIQILDAESAKRKKREPSLFQSLVRCQCCGKNFRFKICNGTRGYHCSTYLARGKTACPAKFIPEQKLIDTTVTVIGTIENMRAQILRIDVPSANHLVYIFCDGHTVERTWIDRSRSESWTDEMRENARRIAKWKGKSQ